MNDNFDETGPDPYLRIVSSSINILISPTILRSGPRRRTFRGRAPTRERIQFKDKTYADHEKTTVYYDRSAFVTWTNDAL